MPNLGMIDHALLNSINKIVNENASLKQQVIQQREMMNDIKMQDISKDVAQHIDNWMNVPYLHGKSKQQDIGEFAFRLTKYIDQRIRN